MHLKRHKVPKNWPIHIKGTKYVVKATSKGVPLLIIVRNMLKLAQNRREVKKAIHLKSILVSGKVAQDEKRNFCIPLTLLASSMWAFIRILFRAISACKAVIYPIPPISAAKL